MKDIYEVLKAISALPMFSECTPLTPTSQSPLGNTPLHVAAICGDNEAVEVLIQMGALINAVGDQGYTPLHEAAEQGNSETVALLLSLGADPTMTTSNGQTYDQLSEIAA